MRTDRLPIGCNWNFFTGYVGAWVWLASLINNKNGVEAELINNEHVPNAVFMLNPSIIDPFCSVKIHMQSHFVKVQIIWRKFSIIY